MIDYEKLKQAHELAHKLYLIKDEEVSMEINFLTDFVEYVLHIEYEPTDAFSNIDKLITRLQELTQIKPKYQIGQEVWRLGDEDCPECFTIKAIDYEDTSCFALDDAKNWWCEEQLYATREALVESQIAHWQSMLSPPFEGEIKGFGCSESIRKHHELEDDDHSEEKLEKVCDHRWRVKIEYSNPYTARFVQYCDYCDARKECNHQRDPNYQGGTWDEIDIHHKCAKCGEFYR